MVRRRLLGLLSLPIATVALSALTLDLKWEDFQRDRRLVAGTVLPPETGSSFYRLKIDGSAQPSSVTVLTIERPAIKAPRYALTGQVRYDGVQGIGYLELWSHFPDGGQYFSRTLGENGPMMKLQGGSGWRPFMLPFDATGAPPPTRLVFNVVLPGRGTVYLGPLQLVEQDGQSQGDSPAGAGWTEDQVGGLVGGLAGGLLGTVGALIGLLTSLGRARRFVTAAANIMVVLGMAAFVLGIVAVTRAQPYALYFPSCWSGSWPPSCHWVSCRPSGSGTEEIEVRRMRAHDLG